jgi:protein SCO1/2
MPGRARRLLRSPFFWAALAGVVTLPLIRPLLRHVPAPPPVLGQLPGYELVDQLGRPCGSEELRGQVYVASFFFTTCRTICPELTRGMRALQQRYQRNRVPVQLVSFSVDPDNDTPRELVRFARRYGADTSSWTFLTGQPHRVRRLILGGFRAHMGPRVEVGDDLLDISHAGVLALVDGAGGVRGYYRPDERGLDEIYHRSRHVLGEAR